MYIKPFSLERYFAQYEFSTKYLLCSSDCDGLSQQEVLGLADSQTKSLWDNLTLGYTQSLGLPLLREEVSGLYQDITQEQVLITAPEEGIFLAMNALLQKGDHVICMHPGYQSLFAIAESIGCEITPWVSKEDNKWRFDPSFLEKEIKSNTKLIIINFPHNPTGALASKEDFETIIALAKKHNIYIFSDEMYRYLEYGDEERLPCASEIYNKAVSLFGMSKTFGLAGLRIGWLVTKDGELYKKIALLKDYTTICSSAPSEILALMALRAKEQIITRHRTRIQHNLQLLDTFFERYKDIFSWVRPKAGTICFPKLHRSEGAYAFCETVVKKTGIMLLPSTVYGYDDYHIRIGFGRENMPEVLEKFETYITENNLLQ